MRQLGMPILATLDMSSFGLALGTVVGRIGDLAIVEHLGRATTVWWGYGIRPGYDVAPQHDGLECVESAAGADGFCGIYHHVAVYDMIGAAILLGVLYFVYGGSGSITGSCSSSGSPGTASSGSFSTACGSGWATR